MNARRWIVAALAAIVVLPIAAALSLDAASLLDAAPATSATSKAAPVGLDPHVGAALPLAADFRDDRNAKVVLGDYFGSMPVLVAPVYYSCPNLCIATLDALADRLRSLDLRAGRDFRIVAVGIDPHEDAQVAASARVRILSRYARCGASRTEECRNGWRFLTGQRSSIDAVADAIGFHYRRDASTGQYVHPIAVVVATPRGRVSHYFSDLELPGDALRDALVQARDERVDTFADRFWLLCDRYRDAVTHSSFAINAIRLAALGGFATLALFFVRLRRTS
jgi:protein SCO1/2